MLIPECGKKIRRNLLVCGIVLETIFQTKWTNRRWLIYVQFCLWFIEVEFSFVYMDTMEKHKVCMPAGLFLSWKIFFFFF